MRSPICVAALAAVALLVSCVPETRIEGYQIRGTEEAQVSPQRAEEIEVLVKRFGTSRDEQRMGRYSNNPQVQAAYEEEIVRDYPDSELRKLRSIAPDWFHQVWEQYAGLVKNSYGVMAVDRNLRGMGSIYCGPSGGCRELAAAGQNRTFKDVHYKHAAIKRCREIVRREFPAEKPACAIFAIKDKIVWKGRLPWE